MRRLNSRVNGKVRRICRAIYNRANDRERLQTLVTRLQEALRQDVVSEERRQTRAAKITRQPDDPFDKIMIA